MTVNRIVAIVVVSIVGLSATLYLILQMRMTAAMIIAGATIGAFAGLTNKDEPK